MLGSSGKVTWQKRSEMPYTCAFMEEVFRFRTLAPFALQHYTNEDAEIGEYSIPKGTMVRTYPTLLICAFKHIIRYVFTFYVNFY